MRNNGNGTAGHDRTPQELLSSRRHAELILDNIAVGIFEIHSGRIVYANPAALRLAGAPEEELLATPFPELFSGSDRERVRELLATINATPETIGEEVPVRLHDRHLTLWTQPVCNPKTTLLVIARETTKRRQGEQALKASPAELEQVFSTAACGMAVIDTGFTVLRANQALLNQFGFGLEIIGRKCHDVLPGPLCRTAECPLIRIMEGEELIERESRKFHADGTPLSLLVTATAFRGPDGALEGIFEDFRDLTARKKNERALRESEERYRDLFENTADLIQNAGPDGRLLYVNPAWRKTLGYGTDEIFRLNVIDIIHPEQRPRCREMFRRIIAGEKVEKIETAFLAKDGRKVLVAGNASCKYAEGKPLYTRGIFHDITERKELELRLRSMATTDELTGAYNRRMFDEILCKQMSRAERQGEPLSMVMLDIDHFKKINDNFGHVAGDEVLRSLAALLRENIRDMDFFARWGGEEFIILLPATPPEAARHLAERLRHIVAGHGFGQVGPVTISLGVARYRQGEPREALLRRADESLYDAKRTGRNKVVMAGGERAFFCMFPAKQGDQQGSKCETVPAHPDS